MKKKLSVLIDKSNLLEAKMLLKDHTLYLYNKIIITTTYQITQNIKSKYIQALAATKCPFF